jgi:hypothetical protein
VKNIENRTSTFPTNAHALQILALNQELIRACMELSQDPNTQPNEMLL